MAGNRSLCHASFTIHGKLAWRVVQDALRVDPIRGLYKKVIGTFYSVCHETMPFVL